MADSAEDAAAGAQPALEARGLSKVVPAAADGAAAGSLTILDDINLTIARGETVAVLGASGSGKSTLLGLLAGLDRPTHGTVRMFGRDLYELDEDGRARLRAENVGFVFQSFQLLPHLTALENAMLPLELGARAPKGETAPAAARALLARVGLQARMQHYPATLSGGEQQRVALARAFVARPPILLADEPTGSLDAATGASVIELMFALNRETGSTLVLVTHDPQIAALCRRKVLLSAGRLSNGGSDRPAA
jgi:putative ABC transport system ATP-binding protein